MNIDKIKDRAEKVLTPYLDTITVKVNQAVDKLGVKAEEGLKDDKAMARIFETVHSSLPLFVRMTVKVDRFVEFCMRHRQRFLPPAATRLEDKTPQQQDDDKM